MGEIKVKVTGTCYKMWLALMHAKTNGTSKMQNMHFM